MLTKRKTSRIFAHQVARELTSEELNATSIGGGHHDTCTFTFGTNSANIDDGCFI